MSTTSVPPNERDSHSEDVNPLDREQLHKLGLLVAGIAHNMNGPLTGMMGNLDLLKMMHPELKDTFDKVGKIGLRLREDIRLMMSKTLAEGRREAGPIDLATLVREEMEFYKADPRLKHETDVELIVPEEIPTFTAVKGDFWQAFSDLLTNAIEATVDVEDRKISVTVVQEGDTIVLSVVDNGVGMSEEVLAKAFEPMFTTKTPSKEGKYPATLATGLGLTHVRNLMDPLGVTTRLESTEGKGTTATLQIPFKQVEAIYTP